MNLTQLQYKSSPDGDWQDTRSTCAEGYSSAAVERDWLSRGAISVRWVPFDPTTAELVVPPSYEGAEPLLKASEAHLLQREYTG